jgi:DNA-binding NarL/FixJ family response regulator/two-component sensor histidine kinase
MTRILIIEDEDTIRQNVLEMLEFEGFETFGAADGLVGLQMAREQLPDLIICDIMMPELDGFGVLEELRSDSATATLPFIFLTAKADRDSMRVGMNLGADDYLTKPFTQAELMQAIHSRLNRHSTIESQRLQALLRRLVQMQESERQQVARQLSEDVEHILAGLKMILGTTRRLPADANRPALLEAEKLINQLTTTVRALSFDLRPVALDDLGLLPALLQYFDRYTAQTEIRIDFRHAGLQRRLPPEVEGAAFRIVQEALTNIARHTAVREASVLAWIDQDVLRLQIEDKGNGFDLESTLNSGKALGLTRMHGHAGLLGGHLMLQSSRGAGTRVSGSLPIADGDSEQEPRAARSAVSAPYAAGALYAKNASPKEVRSITVALADRHDLIRQGMRSLLETEPSFTVVGEAADGWAALELVNRLHPSVLVVDFSLPGLSGTDVTRNITKRFPQTRVLMLSSQTEEGYVLESLKSGAAGYALKQSGIEELIQAVREVASGRRYLSPSLSERAIEVYVSVQQEQDYELGATGPLTSREREVLQLVTDGLTSAQIAEKLSISPRTAETHRANMMRKLGLRNQAELVRYAIQHHIVPLETNGS